ncbi:hypothetical protein DFP72DRAFT_813506 [Ephemerocybe angulata]|uniref:CDR ABC transporter domain-containing protein n=1 Tax=Ephemerocybe angulata TaxID=980116 RepID=A0A8H6HX78_9AGAR|nr:hypothetical protein DFP72DRAFT_813506 [Tulosesus angulatus]
MYKYPIEGHRARRPPDHCPAVEFVRIARNIWVCISPALVGTYYLQNPGARIDCGFCIARTTDQFFEENFNIYYNHRWRNIGIILAFVGFNISTVYLFTYIFRIRAKH